MLRTFRAGPKSVNLMSAPLQSPSSAGATVPRTALAHIWWDLAHGCCDIPRPLPLWQGQRHLQVQRATSVDLAQLHRGGEEPRGAGRCEGSIPRWAGAAYVATSWSRRGRRRRKVCREPLRGKPARSFLNLQVSSSTE